jgi:hypothetical protein
MSLTLPPIQQPGVRGLLAKMRTGATGRVAVGAAAVGLALGGVALHRAVDTGVSSPARTSAAVEQADVAPTPVPSSGGFAAFERRRPYRAAVAGPTKTDAEGSRHAGPSKAGKAQQAGPGAAEPRAAASGPAGPSSSAAGAGTAAGAGDDTGAATGPKGTAKEGDDGAAGTAGSAPRDQSPPGQRLVAALRRLGAGGGSPSRSAHER